MEISRNQQHFYALSVIYDELVDFAMGKGEVTRNAVTLMKEISGVDSESDIPSFLANNVITALNNYGKIVESFVPHLVDWKWERLPLLTQAILLKSYAHFYFVEKVDKQVVINIAVELAKKYIEEKQAKFINAILDGVLN